MNPDPVALGLPWYSGLLWYAAFLLSLSYHEAAHSLAARFGGDPTAFLAGQMTLNPIPHIRREPLGTVIVPVVTYLLGGWMIGWASAPYDPAWRLRYPHRAAWMALAGPLANLTLAVAAGAGIRLGFALGLFSAPASANFTQVVVAASSNSLLDASAVFLSILFSLNLLLATFNLLPIPPLDGNSAIGLLLPESAAREFAQFSRSRWFALVGLLVAWRVFGWLFQPVFIGALDLLYPGAAYQ
jgi:Zn-dependent protease